MRHLGALVLVVDSRSVRCQAGSSSRRELSGVPNRLSGQRSRRAHFCKLKIRAHFCGAGLGRRTRLLAATVDTGWHSQWRLIYGRTVCDRVGRALPSPAIKSRPLRATASLLGDDDRGDSVRSRDSFRRRRPISRGQLLSSSSHMRSRYTCCPLVASMPPFPYLSIGSSDPAPIDLRSPPAVTVWSGTADGTLEILDMTCAISATAAGSAHAHFLVLGADPNPQWLDGVSPVQKRASSATFTIRTCRLQPAAPVFCDRRWRHDR